MIERESLAEKPQRLIEAKYKYLADFNRNQLSPNLKKHYHDHFSKYSNSQDRRSSSYNSSKRKSSYKKSYQKVEIKRRPISPSCSTFNPKRQITLDQFSPYDEKIDKSQEKINKQLIQQNQYMKNQLKIIEDKLNCLNMQLNKKQTQVLKVRELHQCDVKYYEQVVHQMTNQIQIVLTKNKMLENQLVLVKNKLHEEYRRQDQYQRLEQQKRKNQQYKRKQQLRRRQYLQKNQEYKKVDDRKNSNSAQGMTRRSVGKLLVRPVSNANPSDNSLGTSKIKIEDQSQYIYQSNNDCLRLNITNNNEKQNKKGDELIASIRSMQLKISGQQSSSLKDLWKWLKGMGHTHSCFKRWKLKALETCNYGTNQKLKHIIQEACEYIQ